MGAFEREFSIRDRWLSWLPASLSIHAHHNLGINPNQIMNLHQPPVAKDPAAMQAVGPSERVFSLLEYRKL